MLIFHSFKSEYIIANIKICLIIFYCSNYIIYSAMLIYMYVHQVRWALEEDGSEGTMLSPRQRTVRLRGGATDMAVSFNCDRLDTEFSVVSVR
jgi:hypothetical protein